MLNDSPCQSPGAKRAAGRRRAMSKMACCCPHPEERASEIMPPTPTRVRASRRMRTSRSMPPHASRRRASHASVRALHELACAARLLSMRAGAGCAGSSSLTRGSAGTTIFDMSKEPTCGCRKRRLKRAPCFRPVLYRELCNENVWGVALRGFGIAISGAKLNSVRLARRGCGCLQRRRTPSASPGSSWPTCAANLRPQSGRAP